MRRRREGSGASGEGERRRDAEAVAAACARRSHHVPHAARARALLLSYSTLRRKKNSETTAGRRQSATRTTTPTPSSTTSRAFGAAAHAAATHARAALTRPPPPRRSNGMKPVVDYVHSKGLSFGLYTCGGTETCVGGRVGSMGFWTQDANSYASWGVDWVKMDWCVRACARGGVARSRLGARLVRRSVCSAARALPGTQPPRLRADRRAHLVERGLARAARHVWLGARGSARADQRARLGARGQLSCMRLGSRSAHPPPARPPALPTCPSTLHTARQVQQPGPGHQDGLWQDGRRSQRHGPPDRLQHVSPAQLRAHSLRVAFLV